MYFLIFYIQNQRRNVLIKPQMCGKFLKINDGKVKICLELEQKKKKKKRQTDMAVKSISKC